VLVGVLLALVKCDCQLVVGDSGLMLLTSWIQTNINFRGSHNRGAIKYSDLKDLEILLTTQDFQKQVEGHGLTTENILYRCRDHPWLLQSHVGQNYDLYSSFPELLGFFGVLAEITRRYLAFGHCCAFPPRQTRRNSSGLHFQVH
jgi:uncharacterized protein Usg